MKTNIYILLITLLSFSLGNAQSTPAVLEVETISTSNQDEMATVISEVNTTVENDSLLIDASKVNEIIARSSSDIRIYLNRKRKVSNFKLVFTEKYKAIRA